MRLLKFLVVGSIFVCMLALMSGVVTLFEERPDGSVELTPRISRPAVKWYAAQASAAIAR